MLPHSVQLVDQGPVCVLACHMTPPGAPQCPQEHFVIDYIHGQMRKERVHLLLCGIIQSWTVRACIAAIAIRV